MSRGSTLTLYKKYNLKMDDKSYDDIVKKYAKRNEELDYSSSKKTLEDYSKDIPLMLKIDPFLQESRYDSKKKMWIDLTPENNLKNLSKRVIGHVSRDDRFYCSETMNWMFGSTFDCLVEHFNLGHYGYRDSVMEIDQTMASQMLQAINYLLGGNWNDSLARGMNNPYIDIFAEGGMCDSYWKYVHRNVGKKKQKTFRFKEDGYDITIKCPVEKKGKDESEDIWYDREVEESNEAVEHSLENFRNGLNTFLGCDNWERHIDDGKNADEWLGYRENEKYKYVLTYEFWG